MNTAVLRQRLSAPIKIPAGLDHSLLLVVVGLASLGLLMVASASVSIAAQDYQDEFYFVKRHLAYLVLGLVAGLFVLQVPVKTLYKMSWVFVVATLLLLIAVLVPGIGREVNGARRWIGLGVLNLQVAELAKLVSII
jgi:cell division protein FtsW